MRGGGVEEKGVYDRVGYRGGKLANEGVEGWSIFLFGS